MPDPLPTPNGNAGPCDGCGRLVNDSEPVRNLVVRPQRLVPGKEATVHRFDITDSATPGSSATV